jgi:hypothetical protein
VNQASWELPSTNSKAPDCRKFLAEIQSKSHVGLRHFQKLRLVLQHVSRRRSKIKPSHLGVADLAPDSHDGSLLFLDVGSLFFWTVMKLKR